MRVAIVGSRDYPNMRDVAAYVDRMDPEDVVVSGGARGVDTVAAIAARARGMSVVVIPADWSRYGRDAGMIRNTEIVRSVDRVVAFWDGRSPGTKNTMDTATRAGVPLTTFIEKRGRKPTRTIELLTYFDGCGTEIERKT
jgi:hypothetical protein